MPPSVANRSRLKLSELARHLCIPAGVDTTGWPEITDRCHEFGIEFDTWQHGIGTLAFSYKKNGYYACGVGGVWLSIPRQTGKTYLIGWSIFALCSLYKNLTIVWTAHHLRTSDQTFGKMASMAEKPAVRPYIKAVRRSNGQQEIHFTTGSRILFGSRAYGFGRGFDEVDLMVFDECQILTESSLADMLPATNAAPNGLAIFMGTPPRPKDPGEAFSTRRQEAIDGDKDTLYIEFSADPEAAIIDWKQLEKANPSYPHRTSRTAILRMQKLIGSDSNFRREAYGIWDKANTAATVFESETWDNLATQTPPKEGIDCYAVRFSIDGATVALAAARRSTEPGNDTVFVEAVREAPISEGVTWLVDWLIDRKDKAAQIVIEGKSATAYLISELQRHGLKNRKQVIVPSTEQAIAAHAIFQQAVTTGQISHSAQPELKRQVVGATMRKIGKQGGFGWAAATPDESVSILEAATYAVWAAKTTKRRPGRKQVIST